MFPGPNKLIELVVPIETVGLLLFTQLYVSVPDPPLAVTNILPSLAPEILIGIAVIEQLIYLQL